MIIGVTGPIASGKDVFTDMLVEKGFVKYNLSDEVREELRKRGLPIERKLLQDVGNEMRALHGNDYWASCVAKRLLIGNNYVICGIRNVGEIARLKMSGDFVLVGIEAPAERRFGWIIARGKDSDPKTIEGVKAIDSRDRGIGEGESGQQVDACYSRADFKVANDGSLEDLKNKLSELLKEIM